MLVLKIKGKKNKYSEELLQNFQKFIEKISGIKNLENIHEYKTSNEILTRGTDQSSWFHKQIYNEFDKGDDSKLIISYYYLCLEIKKELFSKTGIENWAIQRFPSVRLQFPENISVFEFHRDSDYNHPLGEINFFMGMTKCQGTATLYIEKNLGWENYEPLILNEGEFAMLNTSIFKHGDYINKEKYSRVSIDFRMIPSKVLKNSEQKQSISKSKKFNENDYFRNSNDIEEKLSFLENQK